MIILLQDAFKTKLQINFKYIIRMCVNFCVYLIRCQLNGFNKIKCGRSGKICLDFFFFFRESNL